MNECYWCGDDTDYVCCDECAQREAKEIRENARVIAHRYFGVTFQ